MKVSSMSTRIQYLGFAVIAAGREYSFRVSGGVDLERDYIVTIANTLFLPGRLKYQEGPDISYRKVLTALAMDPSEASPSVRQQLTEAEVTDYTKTPSSKSRPWTEEQRAAARQRFRARFQTR